MEVEVEGRPEFFGKRTDHEWKEGWFKGTVTAIFDDDEFETDCEFEVEYDGYDERILVEVIEDWKEGKVKILPNEEEEGDIDTDIVANITGGKKRKSSRAGKKDQRKRKKKGNTCK